MRLLRPSRSRRSIRVMMARLRARHPGRRRRGVSHGRCQALQQMGQERRTHLGGGDACMQSGDDVADQVLERQADAAVVMNFIS